MPLSVQRKQLLIINDTICISTFLRLPMLPNSRSSCLVGRSSLGSSAAVAVASPKRLHCSFRPHAWSHKHTYAARLENKASLSPRPPQGLLAGQPPPRRQAGARTDCFMRRGRGAQFPLRSPEVPPAASLGGVDVHSSPLSSPLAPRNPSARLCMASSISAASTSSGRLTVPPAVPPVPPVPPEHRGCSASVSPLLS